MKAAHKCSDADITNFNCQLKATKAAAKNTEVLKCSCGKLYTSIGAMRNHQKSCGVVPLDPSKISLSPECEPEPKKICVLTNIPTLTTESTISVTTPETHNKRLLCPHRDCLASEEGRIRSNCKNKNMFSTTVENESGDILLRVAKVYGFRNVQNLVRKMKTKKEKTDYVEIMACPGGCANGGGQIRYKTMDEREKKLAEVEEPDNQAGGRSDPTQCEFRVRIMTT